MRSSKSRSRNKSNRQRSLGNIVNRVFDSSGPEGKVRGTPQQIIDKYLTLARDAQLSNDRVAEQSFLQHAEHYTRMLGEAQREMAERQSQNHQHNQRPHEGEDSGGNGNGNGHGRDNGARDANRDMRDQQQGRDQPVATEAEDVVAPVEAEIQPASPAEVQAEQPQRQSNRRARPRPDDSEQAQAAPRQDEAQGLPDALPAEEPAGPVETPENEGEKKPARSKAPRARTPRSTTGRSRSKAGEDQPAAPAAPDAAGNGTEG